MDNATPKDSEIPDKLYFKIGEVSEITGLAGYVLRFWESEFTAIRPKRTKSGQRLYRKTDIETVFKIKDLLYHQKFTIPGAKKHLKADSGSQPRPEPFTTIEEIRKELEAIRILLTE